MPNYNYIAIDPRGQQVAGSLDAPNETEAASLIKLEGYFPTQITEAAVAGIETEATGITTQKKSLFGPGKISSKALTVFTRQLATLIDAGLPLLRGLHTLANQEKNKTLRGAIVEMSSSVEGGSTFSEAMASHPNLFNKLYVNMVKAGEVGGVLEVVLTRLAEFQEKAQKIKNKVISAMIYPVIVLCIAILILTFLLIFIVPKFQEIFRDMLGDKPLPPLTEFVVAASNLMKNNFLIIVAVVVGLIIGYKLFARTASGHALLDRAKLKFPLLGVLVRLTAISRFARTLGTLVSSGVPILQALNITRETAGNQVLANAIAQVHDSVKEGESVAVPLEASGVFPPMVISMIGIGEETGRLPDMLIKVADVYEDEVDNAVAGLTSLLEPLMIVFLALIVGVIVVALFLPLISIIQELSAQSSG
ncbi:MAG: type II secretion system F family protein [Verrucomicrobiae bacterium]|nr:type II secretion system F family protein [Verrucomicrobiae bacterium]